MCCVQATRPAGVGYPAGQARQLRLCTAQRAVTGSRGCARGAALLCSSRTGRRAAAPGLRIRSAPSTSAQGQSQAFKLCCALAGRMGVSHHLNPLLCFSHDCKAKPERRRARLQLCAQARGERVHDRHEQEAVELQLHRLHHMVPDACRPRRPRMSACLAYKCMTAHQLPHDLAAPKARMRMLVLLVVGSHAGVEGQSRDCTLNKQQTLVAHMPADGLITAPRYSRLVHAVLASTCSVTDDGRRHAHRGRRAPFKIWHDVLASTSRVLLIQVTCAAGPARTLEDLARCFAARPAIPTTGGGTTGGVRRAPSKIWHTSAATISSLITPSCRFHSVFSSTSTTALSGSGAAAPLPPPPLPPRPRPRSGAAIAGGGVDATWCPEPVASMRCRPARARQP